MRHIGQSLDLELFSDMPGTGIPVAEMAPVEVTEATLAKATMVLRTLSDAGLRQPFDFNPDEAKTLWAMRLGRYSIDVLGEATGEFVNSPSRDWPTVGQLEAAAVFAMHERARAKRIREARDSTGCDECDELLWVRVEIPDKDRVAGAADHFMRPCSVCPEMSKRYDLYVHGHFDGKHIDRGGCPECWDYLPTFRHKAKAARRAARMSAS